MRFARRLTRSAMLLWLVPAGCSIKSPPAPSPEGRAIEFLKREVPAWSRGNGCFSCHNNGDAARALYAARDSGYAVPRSALSDTTAWVLRPAQWEHNKGDPGFSDQRLADIQFAASLLAARKNRRPGHTALHEAARRVAAGQDADGAWHIEPQNPAGSPATYGTALATLMAWRILARANDPGLREPAQKAERWLRAIEARNVPSAAVLVDFLSGAGDEARRQDVLQIIGEAQSSDGGWGPYKDSPPEPFDTALVLLALSESASGDGLTRMIQRGRAFLCSQQLPDGSWPATTRPPGGDSYAQKMSTTGWATLALLRTRGFETGGNPSPNFKRQPHR